MAPLFLQRRSFFGQNRPFLRKIRPFLRQRMCSTSVREAHLPCGISPHLHFRGGGDSPRGTLLEPDQTFSGDDADVGDQQCDSDGDTTMLRLISQFQATHETCVVCIRMLPFPTPSTLVVTATAASTINTENPAAPTWYNRALLTAGNGALMVSYSSISGKSLSRP